MKRISKSFFAKFAIGAVLLGWLLTRSDPDRILAAIRSLPAGLFFSLTVLYVASFAVNACKWRLLLRSQPIGRLFRLILIANYYSLIIPGQMAGEAVKALRLCRGAPDPERIAASVAFDRITSLISILFVAAGGLAIGSASEVLPFSIGYLLAPAAVFGSSALLANRSIARGCKKLLLRGCSYPRGTRKYLRFGFRFVDAWRHYWMRPQLLAGAVGIGLVLQGMCAAIVTILGAHLGIRLDYFDWCWIFSLVSLMVFLPVTVGGIGLREGGFVFFLGTFGIGEEKALALSLTLFALQVTTAMIGALVELRLSSPHRSEEDRSELPSPS